MIYYSNLIYIGDHKLYVHEYKSRRKQPAQSYVIHQQQQQQQQTNDENRISNNGVQNKRNYCHYRGVVLHVGNLDQLVTNEILMSTFCNSA